LYYTVTCISYVIWEQSNCWPEVEWIVFRTVAIGHFRKQYKKNPNYIYIRYQVIIIHITGMEKLEESNAAGDVPNIPRSDSRV